MTSLQVRKIIKDIFSMTNLYSTINLTLKGGEKVN